MLIILQQQGPANKEAKSDDMMDRLKATEGCQGLADPDRYRFHGMPTDRLQQNENDDGQTGLEIEAHQKKPVRPRCLFKFPSPGLLTKFTQEPLGFLDMPAEIRNKIYRLALVTTAYPCGPENFICDLTPPALTLVNKQILTEALPIYYAENNFYTLLLGIYQGDTSDEDCVLFHRFTRMTEYFGRQKTSSMDRSPMRHIKNIVVHVRTNERPEPVYFSKVYRTVLQDGDNWHSHHMYSNLCIRGDRQRMTFQPDSATEEESFDPTKYRWTVRNVTFGGKEEFRSIYEAVDLIQMSFTGDTQPIEKAINAEYKGQLMYSKGRRMEEEWEDEYSLYEDGYSFYDGPW